MTDETITLERPTAPSGGDATAQADASLDGTRAAQHAVASAQALRDRVARVLGSVQIRDAQNQGGQ